MNAPFFVSYRRQDSEALVIALRDRLRSAFGEQSVYVDTHSIDAGEDFSRSIPAAIAAAEVVLAIVGPGWLKSVDMYGRRRIDDPDDWVRRELELALRGKTLIPVLVAGGSMPPRAALPEAIEEFAARQAVTLRSDHWDDDVTRLLETLGRATRRPIDMAATRVYRVTDHADPVLLEAFHLYRRRIPEAEQFQPEDIIRWMRQDLIASQTGMAEGSRDYFFVAEAGGRVCGFTLLHWYPRARLAFIAYLVAHEGARMRKSYVASALFASVDDCFRREVGEDVCDSFLLEVDHPSLTEDEREKHRRLARIDLFCTLAQQRNYTLRAIDFDYRQPHLYLSGDDEFGQEPRLLLMTASRRVRASLGRGEVARLLEFIYCVLYPEGFSDEPEEDRSYRTYTRRLFEDRLASLPESVPLLNYCRIRKRNCPM